MRREGELFWFLATLASICGPLRAAERSVSCRLRSSCLLPCPFDPGPEVVVHWLHPPELTSSSVHSFYHGQDQLGRQQPRYRGRTALFHDQMDEGNASLLLSGVQAQDSGRYKCYTSTISGNNEDFVTVEVEAPVVEVSLVEDGSVLKCSSTDVSPEPSVSWTPPSDHSLSVKPSESGLFSVLSSVSVTHSNKEYTCNISTGHSWRSATYRRTDGVTWSGSRTVLSCVETNETMKSLEWTFNRTQSIFKKTRTGAAYSPDWEGRVEQEPGSDLVLTKLTQDQQGIYSCELITDQSTHLTVTEVTVEETTVASAGVIVGVIVPVVVVAAAVGLFLWQRSRRKDKQPDTNNTGENHVKEPLNMEPFNLGDRSSVG